jgi:hypothetical protein
MAAAWVAAVVLGAGALAAQGTSGKIEGTVRDQSGAPLNGAQVFIVGTAMGAVSNERGYYFINNVPGGSYTVRGQYIGYSPGEVRNVRVFTGQTMTINIPLEQRAIEVSGVTVTVEQTPIVPRDQVTSKGIVSGDVITALPVDAVGQILRLQPGVVEGRGGALTIRGGRPGEAATYIDGVLVRSVSGATGTISVGTNALEEASVTTGAVGAEYGDAQSGVVSLVTRAGGQKLRGNFAFATDEPAGNVYGVGNNRLEASLGGPLARNLTFFVAATLQGEQNGRRNKGSEDIPIYVLNGIDTTITVARTPDLATSDSQVVSLPAFASYSNGSRRPLNWDNNYGLDAKLQYTFGSGSRVSFTFHRNMSQGIGYPGRGGLYNPASQYGFWNGSNAYIVNWTQNLVQSSERALFLDATVSYQKDQSINSLIEPGWVTDHQRPFMNFTLSKPAFLTGFDAFPLDDRMIQNIRVNNCQTGRDAARPDLGGCVPYINRNDLFGQAEYRINPYGVTGSASYFPTDGVGSQGGPALGDESRLNGRANFDWQMNRYNRVRFGGDFLKTDTWQFNSGLTSEIFMDAYHVKPMKFGLYANDRIDLGDVVIDLGIRYDRMDTKIQYPRSPGRVFTDPLRSGSLATAFTAEDTLMAQSCATALAAADTTAWSTCNFFTAQPRSIVTPSVRVSFPVTDRTGFRLSYAHQVQTPSFGLLASSVNNDLAFTNTNDQFGRDLTFGKTIMFEFGIRHAFSDDMVLDISAYNKDKVADVTARILPVYDPFKGERQNINLYTNADFGNVRGVDVKLDRRIGQLFQGTLVYTFQSSRTTGSDPNEYLNTISRQISSVTGDRAPAPQALLPSADNRTHTIAGNVALNFPHGWRSGTMLGTLLQDFGFNGTFRFASGLPYTRITNTGAGTTGPGNGFGNVYLGTERLNSATMPWIKNVDLRVTRGFRVANRDLTLFADFRNLFNWTNLNAIFAETGDVVNEQNRTAALTPIVSTLQNEAQALLKIEDVTHDGVTSRMQLVDLTDCSLYQPTRVYGLPNCLMLRRAEERFGNGDRKFDESEYTRAYGAWYNVNSGPQVFYGAGLNIRFGFELNF